MSVEANKILIRRQADELWNKGNFSVFDEVFAANFVDHTPQPGSEGTKEGFRQVVQMLQSALSDSRTTVDELISEEDKVVWRWTLHARHTGALLGIPTTNKAISVTGISLDRIADGQIVERWSQIDNLGLLQQLGVVPAPGQAPA